MVVDIAIRHVANNHTHGLEPDSLWMGIVPLRWGVGHVSTFIMMILNIGPIQSCFGAAGKPG